MRLAEGVADPLLQLRIALDDQQVRRHRRPVIPQMLTAIVRVRVRGLGLDPLESLRE